MSYEQILYDTQDGIATITLNRPERLNAWTNVLEQEVRHAMSEATTDAAVRAIILTGAGRGFCAGADMSLLNAVRERSETSSTTESPAAFPGPVPGGLDLPQAFSYRYAYFPTVPKPIIAAINGPVAGLGLILSLYADLRFASDTAVFTTAFSRRGLIAEHGVDWILPRVVGLPNALDLMLSARKITAQEALHMGLVNRLYPADSFMSEVRDYALELATMVSPRSMRVMKSQLFRAQDVDFATSLQAGLTEMSASFSSEDFKEGVAHFVEKRRPEFSGK